ncbi:hypothetical protein QFC22_001968 [Naganishia vaughanmartiniae]|uniref:Uncharacterized protein n=1 Tax=Naganishia vaughanmartiniae TaxID=1424756 RepID=A0ACC2XGI1_9TREE|nr:hypothetical protein QFC22_001968 [Naganishia vaughanmartiniae]
MSGTIQLFSRSIFGFAVLVIACSSLLASASPLAATQAKGQPYQCDASDPAGTTFYMGDGTPAQCAPGTVCRYAPGQTWSPCVWPDAEGAIAGTRIPAAPLQPTVEIPAAPSVTPSSVITSISEAEPTPSEVVEVPTEAPAENVPDASASPTQAPGAETPVETGEPEEECEEEEEEEEAE